MTMMNDLFDFDNMGALGWIIVVLLSPVLITCWAIGQIFTKEFTRR